MVHRPPHEALEPPIGGCPGASYGCPAVLIRPRFTHRKQRELMTTNDKLRRSVSGVRAGQGTLLTSDAKPCRAAI